MRRFILFTAFSLVLGIVSIQVFSKDKKKDKFLSKYVEIPSGVTEIDGKQVSVKAFWISDREVSNKEYNEFLSYLEQQGKTDEISVYKVKNEKWLTEFSRSLSPLDEYYSTHEAYAYYPALNISHEAATMFCKWLTETGDDKAYEYRLPTKEEWIYAAKGGVESFSYAWGSNSLKNKDGLSMCNYRYIGAESIHVGSDNKMVVMEEFNKMESSNITAPVHSYWTNNHGLYNVCGNVAEMINEEGVALGGSWNSTGYDVRVTSELKYIDASPLVGFRPVKVKK